MRPLEPQQLSDDARGVLDAAYVLRVSEFDLFRLAYRRWYGGDAETKWLEQVFARYMFQQKVPIWVRQFCRDVLARRAASSVEGHAFDRREFGADTVPRREPFVDYPRTFIAITMVVMLLAYVIYLWLA